MEKNIEFIKNFWQNFNYSLTFNFKKVYLNCGFEINSINKIKLIVSHVIGFHKIYLIS